MNWIPLIDKNQISEIKNHVNPSIIFKHSTRCNISAFALKMFERSWEDKMDIKCYTMYATVMVKPHKFIDGG